MFFKVTRDFAVVNIRKSMQLLFVRQASISTFAFCLSLFALALFSKSASAQFTDNLSLGNPKALALGHAVTADPPGIDSIHYNPAGLAKIKGRQLSVKLLTVKTIHEAEFGARHLEYANTRGGKTIPETYKDLTGNEYPDDPFENTKSYTDTPMLMLPFGGLTEVPEVIVPFGGIAIEDPEFGWVFATAVYSPQSSGFQRDSDDPGRYQGEKVGISRITYLSPSIGFQVNDTLAIGVSIGLSWQGLGIISGIRAPETTLAFLEHAATQLGAVGSDLSVISPYDPVGTLSIEAEDAMSFSFNLGLLWEPTPWISFGLVYQGEATSDLKGDYKMENDTGAWLDMTQGIANSPVLNGALSVLNGGYGLHGKATTSGTVTAEYITPAHFSVGTSVQLFPYLKVNVDLKWTDYAAWESLDFHFSDSIDFLTVSDLIYMIPAAQGDGDNADPTVMRIQRQYESVWTWAIGAEYQYSDNLVLRAGYEPRTSSIPEERIDLLAPIGDAKLYTVGFGYQLDAFTQVGFAFAWMHSTYKADAGVSQSANSTEPGRVVYNPYAYLDISGETNVYLMNFSYDTKF